jgi:hypothetical protein
MVPQLALAKPMRWSPMQRRALRSAEAIEANEIARTRVDSGCASRMRAYLGNSRLWLSRTGSRRGFSRTRFVPDKASIKETGVEARDDSPKCPQEPGPTSGRAHCTKEQPISVQTKPPQRRPFSYPADRRFAGGGTRTLGQPARIWAMMRRNASSDSVNLSIRRHRGWWPRLPSAEHLE